MLHRFSLKACNNFFSIFTRTVTTILVLSTLFLGTNADSTYTQQFSQIAQQNVPQSQQNITECKRILWLMGFSWYRPNFSHINEVKFAVLSAQKSSPGLQPLIMFESPPDAANESKPFIDWLKQHNALICQLNNTQLLSELKSASQLKDFHRAIYFRMDVDEYLTQCVNDSNISNKYVIYTDTDVGIVQNIDECNIPKPKVFSLGGEFQPDTKVNSGVMIFNVNEYKKHKSAFFDYCRAQNWKAIHWDQELLTGYFNPKGLIDQLPNKYNFKLYWWFLRHAGESKPMIVHFHGPKMGAPCMKCMLGTAPENLLASCKMCPDIYKRIWLALKGHTHLYKQFYNVYKDWVFSHPPYFNTTNQQLVF
eukprot:TRINITY_DN11702_c0_g1_i5.p1 TRINITY_DN11702_c0_g1~~TRINITY_DN11702_c0_g1_i5.p1  ORF type:complete len:381 (-),score=22.62 TRINITY_DN11702_c0_g1_i5:526-1617(-)